MSSVGSLNPSAQPFELKKNTFIGRGKEVEEFKAKVDTALGKTQLSKDDYKALKDSMVDGRKTMDAMLKSIGVPEEDVLAAFAKGKQGNIKLTGEQKTALKDLLSGSLDRKAKVEKNLAFEGVLQKIEKKGAITGDQLDKLSKDYKGGKEALAKALVDHGIVPQETMNKLLEPHKNFAQKFFDAATSKKVSFSSITAKIASGLTLGISLGVAAAAKNEGTLNSSDKLKLSKENISSLKETIKTGSTKHFAQRKEEMSSLTTFDQLKTYIKEKGISKSEYTNIAKYIPFSVQSEMAKGSLQAAMDNPGTTSKAEALKKIFFAMHQGGLQIRNEGSPELRAWPHNMSDALARGGRVCMVVDQDKAEELVNFLKSGNSNERKYAKIAMPSSHGIDHSSDDTGMGFSESKLKGAKPVFSRTDNSGINIAVGGSGKDNIFGDTISDNGTFGHLMVSYDKSKNPAVIMIGLENSGPGLENQYGGSHDVDCHANDVSATGCPKWSGSGANKEDIPAGLGGMLVDFRGDKAKTMMDSYGLNKDSLTSEQLVGKKIPDIDHHFL